MYKKHPDITTYDTASLASVLVVRYRLDAPYSARFVAVVQVSVVVVKLPGDTHGPCTWIVIDTRYAEQCSRTGAADANITWKLFTCPGFVAGVARIIERSVFKSFVRDDCRSCTIPSSRRGINWPIWIQALCSIGCNQYMLPLVIERRWCIRANSEKQATGLPE